MKIYFCDICNESIPLKDINSNRITIEEGKIFCQKCAPRKARTAERIPGPVSAILLLLVAGGAVLGFYGWKVSGDLDRGQRDLRTSLTIVEGRQPPIESKLGAIDGRLEEAVKRLERLSQDFNSDRTEVQQRVGDVERREAANHDAVTKTQRTTHEALTARLDAEFGEIKKQIQSLQVELAGQKVGVESVRDQVVLLKELLTSREPAGAGAPRAGEPVPEGSPAPVSGGPVSEGGAAPAKEAMEDREVNTLVSQLADGDPGKRYSSVVELARYRGPKVVKALEGMIADPEDYIRGAAIQNLRKIGAVSSIPHIVAALRDKNYFVRLHAINTLRALTGAEVAFDPDGSPSERESRVKEWEKWWESNKERLLRGG